MVTSGADTVFLPGFDVDVRMGEPSQRVQIGTQCVLACRITLEREVGIVQIGDRTSIGKNSNLVCAQNLLVGSDVLISWGCTIIDHNSHSVQWSKRVSDVRLWHEGVVQDGLAGAARLKNWQPVDVAPVTIGDKVWIGFNVIVLKGVTIGEGAVIGAGSVVTRAVPAWTVAAGNPARVIRELGADER